MIFEEEEEDEEEEKSEEGETETKLGVEEKRGQEIGEKNAVHTTASLAYVGQEQ